jgi:hypothetical protein
MFPSPAVIYFSLVVQLYDVKQHLAMAVDVRGIKGVREDFRTFFPRYIGRGWPAIDLPIGVCVIDYDPDGLFSEVHITK